MLWLLSCLTINCIYFFFFHVFILFLAILIASLLICFLFILPFSFSLALVSAALMTSNESVCVKSQLGHFVAGFLVFLFVSGASNTH